MWLLYRHMTASVKTPSRMPTTNRLSALRLQLVATEMSLRIGQRIRQRREELGIRTQRELADLIPSPSVTNQTVNKWEKGVNEPGPKYKVMLAEALGVDVAYFIAPEPKGPTPTPFADPSVEERLTRVEQSLSDLHRKLDDITPLLPGVAELLEELRRQERG